MTENVTRRTFVKAVSTAVAVGTGLNAANAASPEPAQAASVRYEAGKNTHENVVFPCSGGFSNVALISSLASLEAVKELGIEKVAIGCLAGLPNNNVPMVSVLARAARKVLTVDGCPNQCARKIVEAAGLKIARSIVVSEDAHVAKHTFRTDVGGNAKPVMEYLRDEDVRRTKQLIVDAIHDA
jgi:uncharacterized metal-binding protein